MIEKYNDTKTYRHGETCTYEGKTWKAFCYVVGGMTGRSPENEKGSFWLEEPTPQITINDVYEGEVEFDQSFMMTKAEFGNVTVTIGSNPGIK